MKKIFYFIGAAGLLLNGCKEPAVDDAAFAPESSAVRTLTVNGVVETGTRAVWDDETKFAWENDDQITLVSGSTSYESEGLEVDESNPGHGVFTVKNVIGTTFNAFVTANGTYKTGSVEFTVGDTEITAGEVSLKSNVLLVSTSSVAPEDNELTVPLTIVTPLVKFLVYGEASGETITSISIKANAANIAGTASYSFDGNKVTVSEGKASVKATVSDATVAASKDAAEGLYLSVLPTTVSDITYVVTTSAKTYNFTSKSGQTFKENTIYTLPLNLANADADAGVVVDEVTVEDGGTDKKFYLGKTVTVTGTNLDKVSVVKIGETEISDVEAENTTMTFTVPEELEFETESNYEKATEFKLTFDGDNVQSITVYPFYYYPNITIGAQDASNRDKAFFVPDLGRVISTDEFNNFDGGNCFDPYIAANTQKANNSLNKDVIKTADEYYSVPAYVFCTYSTNNKTFSIISPSNSATQIRNFRTTGNDQLTSGYGTPVVGFRNIEFTGSIDAEQKSAEKTKNGSLTSVGDLLPKVISSGAPQYDGTGTANNRFKDDLVIAVQYFSYEGTCGFGSSHTDAGETAAKLDDVYRGGLMYVKTVVTGEDIGTKSTITFDFYWSKPLREK